ncbi:MAG: SufE family protein, partial [Anaerolineae bacterium]
MFASCMQKQQKIKDLFALCLETAAKYEKLIELGRKRPPFLNIYKVSENLVEGCQSLLYLSTTYKNGLLFFQAESEALISSGLAALLVMTYNEEAPEVVLKCPPSFIEELKLGIALTPGRSNGLANMYLHMQRKAL